MNYNSNIYLEILLVLPLLNHRNNSKYRYMTIVCKFVYYCGKGNIIPHPKDVASSLFMMHRGICYVPQMGMEIPPATTWILVGK